MSLKSLLATGTRIWLDSIDPGLIRTYFGLGITGATSNPLIISDLIKTGRFDSKIESFIERGMDVTAIAWALADALVLEAQEVFQSTNQKSNGDDGYVSFELDPLLEDACPDHRRRARAYIDLGLQWGRGYTNRMIKVPATSAGIEALEELAASGICLNVTLIFTRRQYQAARDAIWRGMQRRKTLHRSKSVYSVFLSRIDVYAAKHVPQLSPAAQGQVGLVNAKRIWQMNEEFWRPKGLPLRQEIVFASTGTKNLTDPKDKYVEALAGSDIQTNPPETNAAVEEMGKEYTRRIDQLPPPEVLAEIDEKVDEDRMEVVLIAEGIEKFATPQRALIELIGQKRAALAHTG